jgi:mono/diheme cytochrome c family protein
VSPRRALLAAALAGAACSNDWRTDMWYQPSVRPEDAPRPQPERSQPLGATPRYADRDETDGLRNPVAPTRASLERGREIFMSRCAPCHGKEGHGNGPVSRYFPPAPDLAYATVQARSDGFIYGTVTFGGKAMPPAREGLTEEERWDLVNWVRVVQGRVPPP